MTQVSNAEAGTKAVVNGGRRLESRESGEAEACQGGEQIILEEAPTYLY